MTRKLAWVSMSCSLGIHAMVALGLWYLFITAPKELSHIATPITTIVMMEERVVVPTSVQPLSHAPQVETLKHDIVTPSPPKKVKHASLPRHEVSKEQIQTKEVQSSTVQKNEVISEVSPHSASEMPPVADIHPSYLDKVRSQVQSALRYPGMARKMGLEGEAMVEFEIDHKGMVDASKIQLKRSSGKAVLDHSAIQAVMDAMPFDVPITKTLTIAIPISFKLTT